MPVLVELPDKDVLLEFPDGTSQAEMAGAIDRNFYPNKALAKEQAALREEDEGAFAAKAFGVAEKIVRPFAEPLRATEELIEGVAAKTGLVEPGSKLAVSPDREIGRAVNRMGEVASGIVEDTAAVISGEPETYGGNLLAAATGQPRPYQEAIKDETGWPKFLADVSTTISHITPQIVLQRGLVKAGMAEAPAAGAAFGFTPEGFDPKTALVMSAFPGVAQVGREMAVKALGERVASDTARNVIGEIGGYAAAQTYMDLSAVPDYALMTPEQAKKVWTHNFGVNLAFHLARVPGMSAQALGEIRASRQFQEAISASALESAAARSLPSAAQRVTELRPPEPGLEKVDWTNRAQDVGPATAAVVAEKPPVAGQILENLSPTDSLTMRSAEPVLGSEVYGVKKTTNDDGKTVYAILYTKTDARAGKFIGYSDNPAWELHEAFGKGFGPPVVDSLTPKVVQERPSGGAETITRPDERTGSEMRAEREERPTRRSPAEDRPWDLIDEVESQLGGKISLTKARELIEDFRPTGALRRLFAAEGTAPDVAAQSAGRLGAKFGSDVEFLEALQAAAEARKGLRKTQATERQQLRVEEKQREQFEAKALAGERPAKELENVERVPVQDLFLGDKFRVQNHQFEVVDLEFDPDGRLLSLTVKDGPKFGVQTITPELAEFIHVDKTTFQPVERPTEFAPEAEAPLPKLRPMENQGDLLSTQEESFNLAGQRTADGERIARERAAAEQTAHEAAEIEAKQQQTFAALDPIGELDRPRPAFRLKDGRIVFSKHSDSHAALERDAESRGIKMEDVEAGGWLDTSGKFYVGERSQFEAAKRAEGAPLESRIERPGQSRNIFDLDDVELGRLFDRQFGATEPGRSALAAGRAGKFTFPTFEAFRDWMDARYGERDIEGMRLAFAEASTAFKIGFIKTNKGADAHKRDWIANLATGAPLPTDSPPITRTTPRPMPGGGFAPVTPPPARPGEPPPPPREPSKHRKFDVMALTQLFRQFSLFPEINDRLTRAYGRFVPGTKAVELKERLLWDMDLAEKVIGHELGHFFDLILQVSGRGKELAERLKPMFDFRGQMYEKQALRNEARNLSRDWRGDFRDGDPYRDSSSELFADFLSAMFNRPEWVNQKYPKLYDAFQELRDAKPQFKSAYREIETWLQGETMAQEWMGQQKTAVKRTLDELVKPKEASKASFMDRLKFGTLSLWQRAFEKEGKPRELGESITDELEYNKIWSAKENALFADDFTKRVEPELAKVSSDPVEARTALLSYAQAFRTIFERRAAGVWIENNPVEARAMLRRVLELDDGLRSKFITSLDRATDAELYDISAAVFREVHDRGEPFVNRIAREIDELDLGVDGEAALLAFNVRGKLLNPGGLTPENAKKVMATLEDQLGRDKYRALETAAKELRDMLHDTQSKMHDEGLISDKTWKELIVPNKGNYLPYAVLDFFEGKVRAGVMPQKGTAKDIADIAAATQLKVAASNVWRQQQRQVQLLRDAYRKGGVDIAVGEQLKRARDIDAIRARNPDDNVSRAVLWQDGKPHLVEFPGDNGKLLEKAMDAPAFYEHMTWVAEASDVTHRVMQLYTQWSVPFMFWRNPIRGARTSALKVGFGRVAQQLTPAEFKENARLAKNYADAAFGGEMLPEVRDLVDRQVLLPPRLSQAMVRDSANLRQLLENHTVLANQVRGLRAEKYEWWQGGVVGREAAKVTEKIFSGYEAFEKIVAYHAALEKGLTPAQATAIGRRAGIPKPGVSGKWSMGMEIFFPWTRVHIQGVRATWDILRDPNLNKGFAMRFALTEALPRIAKVAMGTGLAAGTIAWLMRRDEDTSDTVMSEVMRRISPYKMALDDIVPLMFYDTRKGEYHYFWNYKRGADVPKHFEVVSLRLPASEEGRLWGVLLYNLMVSAPGAKDKLSRPGKGVIENTGEWIKNYLLPGMSPLIETPLDLQNMILLGRNPQDPYRGTPAANPKLFDAGGVDRAQAIAGYTLNQLGSPGELAGVLAANFGLLDERALNALNQRLATDKRPWDEKIPFLKTAVSHDNYATYRTEKAAQLVEDQLRAKARLLMSGETRALYDFYYKNVNRKEKLNENEQQQFDLASDFVRNIWGTLTIEGEPNPDSFYSKAAHAVGEDGSRAAKETVKRDLDQAAAGHIANFLELNQR